MKMTLFIIFSLFTSFLFAQNPGDLDRTFVPALDTTSSNSFFVSAVQSDGKIIKGKRIENTY